MTEVYEMVIYKRFCVDPSDEPAQNVYPVRITQFIDEEGYSAKYVYDGDNGGSIKDNSITVLENGQIVAGDYQLYPNSGGMYSVRCLNDYGGNPKGLLIKGSEGMTLMLLKD